MLQLHSISLVQFRNYASRRFDFGGRIVCITGPNGSGKTNLLDAIYYLCFAKSYFYNAEQLHVRYGEDGFRLEGLLETEGRRQLVACTYRRGKKEICLNGVAYERFSRHLGRFPAVIVAPDDSVVVSGGSEQRRRYLDTVLTQIDADYLEDIITYQKVLQQRNSLLRPGAGGGAPDEALLSVLDAQLAGPGQRIYDKRKAFLPGLAEKIAAYYRLIAGTGESADVAYESPLAGGAMAELLEADRRHDLYLGRTARGIHRDELAFTLEGHPLKQSASQGQRKNFLFALKLAQYEILRAHKGFSPLLLLDDIFEKLDAGRVSRLIEVITGPGFGQVFITDTEEARLTAAFGNGADALQFVRPQESREPERENE